MTRGPSERVWIASEELYSRREGFAPNRLAELTFVPDSAQFRKLLPEGERPIVLAGLADVRRLKEELPKALAFGLLPPNANQERLLFALRLVLQQAKLQHDLEAAESVAWSGVGRGQFEDPAIESLGDSILRISSASEMEAVESVLLKACSLLAPVKKLTVLAYPEMASSRVMGLYQLAVPIHFQGILKAHIYVQFNGDPPAPEVDRVSEALLNLSDAVALAVERNTMISRAEETKTVWEASFDAVEDPVVILDERYRVVRGNRAYGRFAETPISRVHGKEVKVITEESLRARPSDSSSEWTIEHGGRHLQVFFDPIGQPLGAGRYVLRLHDVTEERSLTEKILAKEQVAELGVLVGSVAHEINNPIGGILAIGQILLKDVEPASGLHKDMENIVHSAERCRKIIQTMLSLVRKSDEEKRDTDLGECVQSALDLLGSEAKRLQVRLTASVAGGKQLSANRNRLLQVFFHLFQQSLLAIADKRGKQPFEAFLRVQIISGFGNVEVRIEDNGDSVKHDYEIQSSVAFTVARMILEEHEAQYYFTKNDGWNQQRIIFPAPTNIA